MIMPSAVGVMLQPIALRFSVTVAIRFFLYLQFGSILDDGCAFCMGSHNCEDGDLIDQGRDDVPFYRCAFQIAGADQDVRASFAPQERSRLHG